MKTHVAVIKNGIVRSLYTDVIDMKKVGTIRVDRASEVEYDNDAQGWVATIRGDWVPARKMFATVELGPFATRQEALDAEIRYIQEHVLLTP